jgi:hypothetical protein
MTSPRALRKMEVSFEKSDEAFSEFVAFEEGVEHLDDLCGDLSSGSGGSLKCYQMFKAQRAR